MEDLNSNGTDEYSDDQDGLQLSIVDTADADNSCKLCNLTFKTRTEYTKHMYMHKNKMVYSCNHCVKIFKKESSYKRHLNAIARENSKTCDICNKKFKLLRELTNHISQFHKNEKTFDCKFCDIKFVWHKNLMKHLKVHKNNFPCKFCKLIFKDFNTCKTHQLVCLSAIDTDGVKFSEKNTYNCDLCGKEFKFDFSYKAHMEGHSKSSIEISSNIDTNNLEIYHGNEVDCGYIDLPIINNDQVNEAPVEYIIEITPEENSNELFNSISVVTKLNTTLPKSLDERKEKDKERIKTNRIINASKYVNKRPKIFHKKRDQDNHIFNCVMREEKPFSCSICGASFMWEISCAIHQQTHKELYKCNGDKSKLISSKTPNYGNKTAQTNMDSVILHINETDDESDSESCPDLEEGEIRGNIV